jgi:hypothetical protein
VMLAESVIGSCLVLTGTFMARTRSGVQSSE